LISCARVVGLSEGMTGIALSAASRIMASPRVITSAKGACKKHILILPGVGFRHEKGEPLLAPLARQVMRR
jgi:hypothetical protein